jgi:hypothetical protein
MRLAHVAGDDGSLLVLSLEDPARADLFTTVCADAVQTAAGVQRTEALESFLARLDPGSRWLGARLESGRFFKELARADLGRVSMRRAGLGRARTPRGAA